MRAETLPIKACQLAHMSPIEFVGERFALT